MENKENVFLSVKDLSVIYTSGKKTVRAVNHVSFNMKKGETLALVGETGAGKTTIARAILGILPNPPAKLTGGEILLEGKNMLRMQEKELLSIRGNRIAMIFQDPMTALNPLQTVGDQILEGIRLHGTDDRAEAKKKACEMLEMVGIPAARYPEYPFEFSGGMKQRVVIAMALACNPDLLLADEPTTALDVTIQAQVMDLIRSLKELYNTAMLLISHDLGVVAEASDYVAVVYAGEIIEYGNKEDIFIHPQHPYTIGLFNSMPGMNEHRRRLKLIEGSMPDPTDLPEGCKFHPRCAYASEECKKGDIVLREIKEGHLCRCIHEVRRNENCRKHCLKSDI